MQSVCQTWGEGIGRRRKPRARRGFQPKPTRMPALLLLTTCTCLQRFRQLVLQTQKTGSSLLGEGLRAARADVSNLKKIPDRSETLRKGSPHLSVFNILETSTGHLFGTLR